MSNSLRMLAVAFALSVAACAVVGEVDELELAEASELSAAPTGAIRVATFNVRHGTFPYTVEEERANPTKVREYGKRHIKTVATVIRNMRADIVCAQELDRKTVRAGEVDQVAVIRDEGNGATPFHYSAGVSTNYAAQGGTGTYGLAIFSRFRLSRGRTLSAGSDTTGNRIMQLADVALPNGRKGLVVCTHMSFTSSTRAAIARRIVREAAGYRDVIVLGDFNENADYERLPASERKSPPVAHRYLTSHGFTDGYALFGNPQNGETSDDGRIDFALGKGAFNGRNGQARGQARGTAIVVRSSASDHFPMAVTYHNVR